jgi:hypothetical protein
MDALDTVTLLMRLYMYVYIHILVIHSGRAV